MWLMTGEKYAEWYGLNGGKAIKPDRPFRKGGEGWGAWELGARFTKFDASDFKTTNPPGTGVLPSACNGLGACTNEANAVSLGLKWIPTTNTRMYLNYVQTKFETPVGDRGGEQAERDRRRGKGDYVTCGPLLLVMAPDQV